MSENKINMALFIGAIIALVLMYVFAFSPDKKPVVEQPQCTCSDNTILRNRVDELERQMYEVQHVKSAGKV